jgi:hypothetical protein
MQESSQFHDEERRCKGLSVRPFHGCGGCEMNGVCQHKTQTSLTRLRYTGGEIWDCGGTPVSAFTPGDIVNAVLRHDETHIYCAVAESTSHPGVSDFIHLGHFEEMDP